MIEEPSVVEFELISSLSEIQSESALTAPAEMLAGRFISAPPGRPNTVEYWASATLGPSPSRASPASKAFRLTEDPPSKPHSAAIQVQ